MKTVIVKLDLLKKTGIIQQNIRKKERKGFTIICNKIKNDFKNSSQEYDSNMLHLVKQKGFHPCEFITDFEKFKGCVLNIFASLFCMSKRQHLRNREKSFLFHFESSSFLRQSNFNSSSIQMA